MVVYWSAEEHVPETRVISPRESLFTVYLMSATKQFGAGALNSGLGLEIRASKPNILLDLFPKVTFVY